MNHVGIKGVSSKSHLQDPEGTAVVVGRRWQKPKGVVGTAIREPELSGNSLAERRERARWDRRHKEIGTKETDQQYHGPWVTTTITVHKASFGPLCFSPRHTLF